tara:strand:+ start:19 stop:582 length:564 start_codon:yes stop_codon:yes gene_type:complete
MAVSITCSPAGDIPTSQFADKVRPDYTLSHSVSASTNTQTNNQNWSVTSTNCTAVTYSYYDGGGSNVGGGTDLTSTLTITPGTSSVSISGTFNDPFSDSFTYVEKGGTDLEDTPTTVVGVSNMPAGKDFYFLDQDQRWYVLVTFTIQVVETAPSPYTGSNTATFYPTLRVENSWEGIRSFVDTYYDT